MTTAQITINDTPLTPEQVRTLFTALEFYVEQEADWIADLDPNNQRDAKELAEKQPEVDRAKELMDLIDPTDEFDDMPAPR